MLQRSDGNDNRLVFGSPSFGATFSIRLLSALARPRSQTGMTELTTVFRTLGTSRMKFPQSKNSYPPHSHNSIAEVAGGKTSLCTQLAFAASSFIMAASMDPKAGFKQDMVVSTRYRNDLPAPPMPPKLLDIDNGGLAQYLTTSFASAMARREEPNIEVDAEGGMPIDMIGIPGYFLGDESGMDCTQALSTSVLTTGISNHGA